MSSSNLWIKMLLLGDGGVGKSAFRRAWLGETFKSQYLMTLGADFASKQVILNYEPTETIYNIRFQIWDLAGQPRFKDVVDLFYRGAAGALCFFDITNQGSFNGLHNWINSFWTLNSQGKRPIIIVGAKCDLKNDPEFKSQVTTEQGIEYAKNLTRIIKEEADFTVHYIETSAKEEINVEKTFHLLATEIISSVHLREQMRLSALRRLDNN